MTERVMRGFLNRMVIRGFLNRIPDQINPLSPFLLGAGPISFMPKARRSRATMKGKGHIHTYLIMAPEVGYGSPPPLRERLQEMNL